MAGRRAVSRWAGVLSLLAATSAQADLAPFDGPVVAARLEEPEQRVWSESEDVDRGLANSGQVIADAGADAYLRDVMARLFPAFGTSMRVHLVRDAEMNSFCLPNGSIYLNLGMLARVRNESQLATILGHEGTHFTHRHGYRQRGSSLATAAWVHGAGLAGGFAGDLLGSLLGISSIRGFSRSLEREADLAGFGRMLAAGYAPQETIATFDMLAAESTTAGLSESLFFASHPRLVERIESFRDLARKIGPAPVRTDSTRLYELQRRLHREWLDLELSLGHGKRLIFQLTRPDADAFFPPEAPFYLGEAYRLTGEPGHRERMLAAYSAAAARAPAFAPTYAALGVHHFKNKDCMRAVPAFRTYLDIAPDGQMAPHVRRLLDKCS